MIFKKTGLPLRDFNIMCKYSITIAKRYGEIGSPLSDTPFAFKIPEILPLILYLYETYDNPAIIYSTKILGNPSSFIIASRAAHSTESDAL